MVSYYVYVKLFLYQSLNVEHEIGILKVLREEKQI
jgi:hypothetical protein